VSSSSRAHRPTSRSTGRVVGGFRASLLVVEGLWTWYRRNWRASAVSSFVQPLLYLLALGWGLGALVDGEGRAARATGGVSYLEYLAPALVVMSAVQNAAGESTYPVLSGFKWQKNYWAVVATPIGPAQLATGQLLWIVIRLSISGAVYLLVATLLGAVGGPGVPALLLVAVLTGMALAAPLVAYSASLTSEGQEFNMVSRFVVVPMTLFAGTFFPVEQLPAVVRPLAWITPLWHGTELARGAALGGLELWPALGHVAYLVLLLAAGVVLAHRRFRIRLAE